MAAVVIRRYCICGSALQLSFTPPDEVRQLVADFDARHRGAGHGPATAKQAAQARRQAARMAAREEIR